jgi:hypothetical protein
VTLLLIAPSHRVAGALFAQDVASCIFQGRPPSFSPLKLGIELPSYESCWIAESAEKCLQELQRIPSQPRLAQALLQLRVPWSSDEQPVFEVSAFGMFILIKGLHCLVWYATHYDLSRQSNIVGDAFLPIPPFTNPDLLTQLDQGLSGPAVAEMVDKISMLHGSSTLASVNQHLDNWRQVWSLRKFRDESHENRCFALDPMPFWWLAKALLLLHCNSIATSGDRGCLDLEGGGSGIYGNMLSQAKVFRWLVNFRRRRGTLSQSTESTQGDSMVDLMQPISDEQPHGGE